MGQRVDEALRLPRGLQHPYVHVQYWPEGSTHEHILSGCMQEPGESFGEYLEDVANELAETVLRCGNQKHGKGQKHGLQEAQNAYGAAVKQLLSRDYWAEYVGLQRKIEHHAIWGGPVPALVIQPNPEDKGKWQVAVTHPETGLPAIYNTDKNILEMPWPDRKKFHQGGLGFYRKGK